MSAAENDGFVSILLILAVFKQCADEIKFAIRVQVFIEITAA